MPCIAIALLALTGCTQPTATLPHAAGQLHLSGSVHGGQQAISQSSIQLYAASDTGLGSASTPLLTQPVHTGPAGDFSITGLYTCPSPAAQVYLVATGGNPGLSSGSTNPNIALMTSVGPCGSLNPSRYLVVNEVTTVASVWPLAAFLASATALGADPASAPQLAAAAATVPEFADVAAGVSPGPALPAGATAPVSRLYTLANVLATCINSAGGKAGDPTPCGRLFTKATAPNAAPPTDTIAAAIQIARHPTQNVADIFYLTTALDPFQPHLALQPPDWTLDLSGLAPPAEQLAFLSQPASTSSGSTLDPAITVAVEDSTGNILASASATITLTSATASLSGATTASTTNGVATFPGLSISAPGSYTLTASSTSLPSATSSSFSIAAPPPAPAPTLAIALPSTQIDSGRIGSGTLTLSQPAPAGGLTVTVSSSSPARIAITTASVLIPAGQTSAPFFFTAATPGPVTLSASAPGFPTARAPLTSALPVASPLFFGLTVLDYANVNPTLLYNTTRTWDAHPALDWAEANPAPGVFNFAPLNTYIALNTSRNAQIVYTFGRTPLWASTNPTAPGSYSPGQCAAPTLSAWDQYVTAIVTNAAGRIRYWELWNEPDQPGTWCSDLPTMVTMAQHAYKIIKSIDPSALVLSPAPSGGAGATWLNNFIVAGGRGTFDIVAFHGYEGAQAERITAIVDVYRLVLARYNLSALPLWDTECSWGAGGAPTIGDDTHRAAFLSKYFVLQFSKAVDRVLWYAYDSVPEWGRLADTTNNPAPAGQSSPAAQPAPAAQPGPAAQPAPAAQPGPAAQPAPAAQPSLIAFAYQETRTWLLGATLTQPCAVDASGTYTCNLSRSNGYTAQVLWNSTATTTATIPPGMTEYRDLSGATHPLNGATTLPATNSPILLESAPIPN